MATILLACVVACVAAETVVQPDHADDDALCGMLSRSADPGWGRWRIYGSATQERTLRQAEAKCQQGHVDCCRSAGVVYRERVVAPEVELAKARKLLGAACEMEDGEACRQLAVMYASREGGVGSEAEASEYREKAALWLGTSCRIGDARACVQLANACAGRAPSCAAGRGLAPCDRALSLYRAYCVTGDAEACRSLGSLVEEAKQCAGEAAAGDERCACAEQLRAVEEAEVVAAFRRACDGRDGHGCVELSRRYLVGAPGALQSGGVAASTFERACTLGVGEACVILGWAYAKEEHGVDAALSAAVPKDLLSAAKLFARGCEVGDGYACWELGRAYLAGRGFRADRGQAVEYLRRACQDGVDNACEDLVKLGATLGVSGQ